VGIPFREGSWPYLTDVERLAKDKRSSLFCFLISDDEIYFYNLYSRKTQFTVNFSFEERQWIKFEVYDWDKGEVAKAKLADQVSISYFVQLGFSRVTE
jgi:hypothetical protein